MVNCILTTSTNTGNCDIVQGFALNHRVGDGTELDTLKNQNYFLIQVQQLAIV